MNVIQTHFVKLFVFILFVCVIPYFQILFQIITQVNLQVVIHDLEKVLQYPKFLWISELHIVLVSCFVVNVNVLLHIIQQRITYIFKLSVLKFSFAVSNSYTRPILLKSNSCTHCTRFKPVWDAFVEECKKNNVKTALVEVDIEDEGTKPLIEKHKVRG